MLESSPAGGGYHTTPTEKSSDISSGCPSELDRVEGRVWQPIDCCDHQKVPLLKIWEMKEHENTHSLEVYKVGLRN